jgi:CheY-like chemotaxis protein
MMPTVLVVDDEPLICRLVTQVLRTAGFQVCEAADGLEAEEQFLRHDPDLVLTDLYMPGLNGAALARRIHEWKAIPVLIMTAGMVPTDITYPVIHKPFPLQTLVDTVHLTLSAAVI